MAMRETKVVESSQFFSNKIYKCLILNAVTDHYLSYVFIFI